MLNNIFQF